VAVAGRGWALEQDGREHQAADQAADQAGVLEEGVQRMEALPRIGDRPKGVGDQRRQGREDPQRAGRQPAQPAKASEPPSWTMTVAPTTSQAGFRPKWLASARAQCRSASFARPLHP
jgi:hypothetical protein